ncbi:tetrahydromethanopterin S-methyltransferase, subunit D [Methanosalsum zhilinae DSM 4017]|uniref:Tetrahydromethanopterin S-methyltransferase subunit D n=1 Tax=Methanosalsum zhilinae (strain DSM 4017 / NBRC 107636 / OCM 62 / WeN5) TaxID=679901 RepID=F7XQ91_METZD|nr:tetrahydromethanopterin S-methyltransferase subunit D [Methanosalsum zhilinae]AEH61553.1 tetrahydromethanopterin S-methyltransferase, subunit D [Methanosalsum zhilinae DSM 4017]
MIDFAAIIAENILYLLLIIVGGLLVAIGVHFVPVGGAPAAMAQSTGVGTGTVQLAAGAGLTGLVAAGAVMQVTDNLLLVIASGMVGAMIMIGSTMLVGNMIYIYGVGVPPASAKIKYDPITRDRQDLYISQGTEGHGVPTSCFISGIIGGGLGGLGGAMVYFALLSVTNGTSALNVIGLASIFSVAIFFINAVIASYNIGGTTEGFHDPKFKRLPKAVVSSIIVTFISGILSLITIGGL